MEIYIGEKYKLTSDAYNVILNEIVVPKQKKDETDEKFKERTKEPKYVAIGYYSTIEKACVGIINKVYKENESTGVIMSLMDLLEVIERTKHEILNMNIISLTKEEEE